MNRPRLTRGLQIAVSALCLVVCARLAFPWANDVRNSGLVASVPYAFYLLFWLALGAAPWAGNVGQFSLRTLLITTTLVAMVLGLIAATT